MPTLNWIGKEAVQKHHLEIPFRLLEYDENLSSGVADSDNLIVQGDNLHALKALLPYYAGKVKCIYIDPPYNTGNEKWQYNDNVNAPEIKEWLNKTVGSEGEDLSRHDKWLCMMYPRLQLLKRFLKPDGIIFCSIDENEAHNLKLVFDEIFGIKNHIETLIWKKSYGGGAKSKHVVNLHEYILFYAKNTDLIKELTLPPDESILKYYKFKDSKIASRGPYRLQPLATTSMDDRPNLRYAIEYQGENIMPTKQWQWSKERVLQAIKAEEIVIEKKKGKWSVNYKQYLKDSSGEERGRKLYSIIDNIYTQKGTNELRNLINDSFFTFPKPSLLIKTLIQLVTEKDSLILDSFAGSGTTGHAVLQLNKEDGGNRKFIMIEMEENIAANITAERIKRVSEGYEKPKENGETETIEGLGGGFKFCRLASPLFDQMGNICENVKFNELARHIYFSETGLPLTGEVAVDSSLLGIHKGTAIYLLFNGILGDKTITGGNILTSKILAGLPKYEGPKIIFGEGNRLSASRLRDENIIFKQIPFEIRTS